MIQRKQGKVEEILYEDQLIQELALKIEGKIENAINYASMLGRVCKGDVVLVNTTAVELGLGTGGWHFVMHTPYLESEPLFNHGHILKNRYTPFQMATGSCEEQCSPYHEKMKDASSIDGLPVLVGELHSMLPVVATYIKKKAGDLRFVYIMTDNAALPISFSHHVRTLKNMKWMDGSITIGQAFGGDLEAVNIYSGLLAAKTILKADIIFVSMGPGITGTGTKFGFSGMEQVETLHAVHSLGGTPILIPRMSMTDVRQRHNGLSHHTRTVLEHTLIPVHVPLLEDFREYQETGIHHWNLRNKDRVRDLETILESYPTKIKTMQRDFSKEPAFFYSVACAVDLALEYIYSNR